jgi:predicted nucleic acid-binding protein
LSEGETGRQPRALVLDTSVAVKWHLEEEHSHEAARLLDAAGAEISELLAPSTLQPEFFNTLWQRRRRGELEPEEVRQVWSDFLAGEPVTLYDPADLMPRATELVLDTGVIIYDALFLVLAEHAGTVMVTADDKLLRALEGTGYADLARSLAGIDSLLY